jgi:hypothetical protein
MKNLTEKKGAGEPETSFSKTSSRRNSGKLGDSNRKHSWLQRDCGEAIANPIPTIRLIKPCTATELAVALAAQLAANSLLAEGEVPDTTPIPPNRLELDLEFEARRENWKLKNRNVYEASVFFEQRASELWYNAPSTSRVRSGEMSQCDRGRGL